MTQNAFDMTHLVLFVLGGVINGVFTIAVLRTDMAWIKECIKDHSKRILHIERQTQCQK